MRTLVLALLTTAALAACKPDAQEPRFTATCGPNETLDGAACTVTNVGTVAARACATVRLSPEDGTPALHAQRVCSAVLPPKAEKRLPGKFVADVVKACVRANRWTCKVDTLETQAALVQNQPGQR